MYKKIIKVGVTYCMNYDLKMDVTKKGYDVDITIYYCVV